MAKSKVKAQFVDQYLIEIFGNEQYKNPLLLKALPQKTKFNLKKLGNTLQNESKAIREQRIELREKYSQEKTVEIKENPDDPESKIIKNVSSVLTEETREEYIKLDKEILEMDVEFDHYDFQEADFMDGNTNKLVFDENYLNLLDLLLFEEKEEAPKEKKHKLEAV